MVGSWLEAIKSGKLIGCGLVDFRKAFDLVDHRTLLKKLRYYKCQETCLKWFESYLTSRTQRVYLGSHLSDPAYVTCGVPQGSILGPLLFLIFINDLPLALKQSAAVDLYADDTIFYDFQTNIDQLQSNLQLTLNSLQDWCRQNGMVINTEKTKVMLITTRQKRQPSQKSVLSLHYSDIDIRMSTCDKILGVYVDENLLWNDKFHHILKKVASYLWLLSKIRSYLSPSHIRYSIMLIYIKPHIEYCSIIWSNTSNSNINKINKLQRRACKLILSQEYSGLEESLKRPNILSFDQSVFLNKAKIMYKVHNNIAPSYLQELFHMRDINLNNSASSLRSVAQHNYIVPLIQR